MTISDRFEEIKSRLETSGLSSSDKTFVESNFERVLSRTFTKRGCSNCYNEAFIEMYIHFRKYGIKKMGLFIMKRGHSLHTAGDVFTRVNMTDEIAAELLNENPKRETAFENLPENWEELVKEIIAESKGEKTEVLEDSAEQIAAEKALISDIAKLIFDKTSKKSIRKKYEKQSVGVKNLTQRSIAEFIKKAEELIATPSDDVTDNDEEIDLDTLNREELEIFVNDEENEIKVVFDEKTTDEELRNLIVEALSKDTE